MLSTLLLLAPLHSTLLLAPVQDCSWTPLAPSPKRRFEAPTVVVGDELILFGGVATSSIRFTTLVDAYHPATDTWRPLADLPRLLSHGAACVEGPRVWLAGGFVGHRAGFAVADVWVYDVESDTWSAGPPLPRPLAAGALVRDGRRLHFFGGVEADRDTSTGDHWVLDLDRPSVGWRPLPQMPEPRNHHSGVLLVDGIHALGGQRRHDRNPTDTNLHHVFDPQTLLWREAEPLPSPRSHFEPGTVAHGGRVWILGGHDNVRGLLALADVHVYDPRTDRWTARPPLPEGRLGVSAGIFGDRLIATCGGTPTFVPRDQTWSGRADPGPMDELRVNCGGGALVDARGRTWCADLGALDGFASRNPLLIAIAGTEDDALYLDQRAADPGANLHYRLPVDRGRYRVVLHLAELEHGVGAAKAPPAGARVLRVIAEGKVVVDRYDVAAEVGPATATTLKLEIQVRDDAFDLELHPLVGSASLAGLELVRLPFGARFRPSR